MVFFYNLEQRKATYLKSCFFSTFFFLLKVFILFIPLEASDHFVQFIFHHLLRQEDYNVAFFISESEMTNDRPIFHSRHEMVIICEHLIDNLNLTITLILF